MTLRSFVAEKLSRASQKLGGAPLPVPLSSYKVTGGSSFFRRPNERDEYELACTSWVYACLQKRAKAVANLTFKAYQDQTQEKASLLPLNHWCSAILANPNSHYTRYHFYSLISFFLDIAGNAFLYVRRSASGVPVDMWILPPVAVEIVFSEERFIQGYIFQIENRRVPLDRSEVLHFRDLQAQGSTKHIVAGTGKVKVLSDVLGIDASRMAFFRDYFSNSGTPNMVALSEGQWKEEKWNDFRDRFNAKFPTPKLVALLEAGLQIEPLVGNESQIASQMKSGDLSAEIVKQVCAVMDVPVGLITGDFQNRATAEVHRNSFFENAIEPLATYIDQEFTRFFRQYDPTLLIEHDRYTPQNADFDLQKQRQLLEMGVLTINDIRQREGLEPVPEGNARLVASTLVPLETLLSQAASIPEKQQALKKKSHNSIIHAALAQTALFEGDALDEERVLLLFWKSWAKEGKELRKKLKNRITGVFSGLEKEVLANLDTNQKHAPYRLQKDIDAGFDVDKWKDEFEAVCTPDLRVAIEQSFRKAVEEVGGNWADARMELAEEMKAALRDSIQKIRESVDTAAKELQEIVRKVTNDHADKPPDELRRLIQEAARAKFVKLKEGRAKNIAQTTSTFATTRAQRVSYDSLGFDSVWLSQRGGRVRMTHLNADGQKADSEGYFYVGSDRMKHPCGGSQAKENCNCECVLRPRPKS